MYNIEAWNSTWITLAGRNGHASGLDGIARVLARIGERMENGRESERQAGSNDKPTESLTVAAMRCGSISSRKQRRRLMSQSSN